PKKDVIKINCHEAVSSEDSVVALIARDWRENLVFAFSCKVNTNIPVQVMAEALRWTTFITVKYNLVNVVIESDCQTCIQCLSTSCASIPWHLLIFC
ncbi:hypothetical protein CFP56_030581, partial [Quercus suber]